MCDERYQLGYFFECNLFYDFRNHVGFCLKIHGTFQGTPVWLCNECYEEAIQLERNYTECKDGDMVDRGQGLQ